jgi:hypothetical protein
LKIASGLVLTLPVFAHVASMSTGEARLNGARLDYELRMPRYEAAHMRNPETDQAVFDGSFTEAAIRFRPPTALEAGIRDAAAGFWRGLPALAQWFFLAALALAGRPERELIAPAAAFFAGHSLTVAAGFASRLQLSPRSPKPPPPSPSLILPSRSSCCPLRVCGGWWLRCPESCTGRTSRC